jgi:hypothetical protein
VLAVGLAAFWYASRSSRDPLNEDVVYILKHGTEQDRSARIALLAERYQDDVTFWRLILSHAEPAVRQAGVEALGRFRRNIPEAFFRIYKEGRKEDILTIYTALVHIAPWCDLRFAPDAIADCADPDPDISRRAYSYLAFQSVEDWTPEEVEASGSGETPVLRWTGWYNLVSSLDRRGVIDDYVAKLLERYSSPNQEIRQRAWEALHRLLGETAFELPSNEAQPDLSECLKWWDSRKQAILAQLMELISWDEKIFGRL